MTSRVVHCLRDSTTETAEIENLCLQQVRDHAAKEQLYHDLKKFITNGFPNKKGVLPQSLKEFWSAKDHLTIDDGLIVYIGAVYSSPGHSSTSLLTLP